MFERNRLRKSQYSLILLEDQKGIPYTHTLNT